ncbi:hypothetical protein JOL79_06855 [Microbispora sp. RL4-1S]|uniref:Uncharacterized protein n=1 Tax=Microbispora oryzae TaxID=2806554 RepID=A0A940WGB4_9ACTN|nr:hypothetical protein [Microbispora oryzae]MBP2703517.1 hypothetical protein [Microbispora oryzae]
MAPWHPRTAPCRDALCWICTPHEALRDHVGDTPWGRRIFKALLRADPPYTTPEQIAAASDEQLLAVKSIGTGALQYLRDRQAGEGETIDKGLNTSPAPPAQRLAAQIEQAIRRQTGERALP